MTREEAIELIDDRMCYGRGKWSEHHMPEIDEYWKAGQMAIKALVAEPKTGKWIKNYSVIRCSECKRSSWSLSFEDLVRSFKYCPNCGAKMEGDAE